MASKLKRVLKKTSSGGSGGDSHAGVSPASSPTASRAAATSGGVTSANLTSHNRSAEGVTQAPMQFDFNSEDAFDSTPRANSGPSILSGSSTTAAAAEAAASALDGEETTASKRHTAKKKNPTSKKKKSKGDGGERRTTPKTPRSQRDKKSSTDGGKNPKKKKTSLASKFSSRPIHGDASAEEAVDMHAHMTESDDDDDDGVVDGDVGAADGGGHGRSRASKKHHHHEEHDDDDDDEEEEEDSDLASALSEHLSMKSTALSPRGGLSSQSATAAAAAAARTAPDYDPAEVPIEVFSMRERNTYAPLFAAAATKITVTKRSPAADESDDDEDDDVDKVGAAVEGPPSPHPPQGGKEHDDAQRSQKRDTSKVVQVEVEVVQAAEGAALLRQSGLALPLLRTVWTLADPHNSGQLTRGRFYLALRLVAVAQAGHELSQQHAARARLAGPFPVASLAPPPTSAAAGGVGIVSTIPPAAAGSVSVGGATGLTQQTGGGLVDGASVEASAWRVTPDEVAKWSEAFRRLDAQGSGLVSDAQAHLLFQRTPLPAELFTRIWRLSAARLPGQNTATLREFIVFMKLCTGASRGWDLPPMLPPSLRSSLLELLSQQQQQQQLLPPHQQQQQQQQY
mmetsp:Transcript_14187/g.42763  ORF Transcript_14187/g.42763 Transcript_14187/m.42763 type:complete len:625 (-) Transcript_14187:185-2059(-)